MRHVLAILACLGLTLLYVLLAAALGWRRGGGLIPLLVFFAALGGTWRIITKGKVLFETQHMKDFNQYIAQAELNLKQGNRKKAVRLLIDAEETAEYVLKRSRGEYRTKKEQMFKERLKPLREKIQAEQ